MCIFDVLISNSRFPSTIVISESNSRFPNKADVVCFRSRFPIPIHDSAISRFRESARFRDCAIPRFRDSAISHFRIARFRDSAISRFRNSTIWRFRGFTHYPQKRCRVNIPDVRSKRIGSAAPRLPPQLAEPPYAQRGVPLGLRAHPFEYYIVVNHCIASIRDRDLSYTVRNIVDLPLWNPSQIEFSLECS